MAGSLIQAGSRITAALLQSIAPLAVIKGSDESLTSNATLQNDNELLVAVVANATYLFNCYLDYEGAAGANLGIKWTWSVPAGSTLRYQGVNISDAASPVPVLSSHAGSATVTAGGLGAGTLAGVSMDGSLVMGATGGVLQLQWAQDTSSATPTIVHAQSLLALWRVS